MAVLIAQTPLPINYIDEGGDLVKRRKAMRGHGPSEEHPGEVLDELGDEVPSEVDMDALDESRQPPPFRHVTLPANFAATAKDVRVPPMVP